MNIPYAIAAGLMALTAGIHVFAGGPEYHAVYQRVLPTPYLAAMAAVLWHAVTVNLVVFAAAFLWLTRRRADALAVTITAMQIGWAGLFLFYGITMLGSPWPMPQWVIFIVGSLLAFIGLKQAKRS